MRAFVAVEVPPLPVRSDGRVAAPAHITLRFLGEVPGDRIEAISARLEAAARRIAAFEVRIEGVGAFPSVASPRVVWLGVSRGGGELEALAAEVRAALEGEGDAAPEGRFVPHVTWFRVRSSEDRSEALDALTGRRAPPPPCELRVDEFVLKESQLGRGGAVHRSLRTFRLGGGSATDGGPAGEARPSTSLRQR